MDLHSKEGDLINPERTKGITPPFQIEKIAKDRDVSVNRLVVDPVMKSSERRGCPRTELDIQVAKAALSAVRVLRHDPIAAGREDDVEETLQFVSALVSNSAVNSLSPPDPPPSQSDPKEGSWQVGRPLLGFRGAGAIHAAQAPYSPGRGRIRFCRAL